ncbi:MAG: 3-methyladenine DNA glycosylase 2 [Deltaproteobacteria bacterium]|nr:3-methyladenine DNA glycosylase 2 [Deltaproteobacteria bacterium]
MPLDPASCERARQARDARFDGRFFISVRTTGVYCRPICPVRMPRAENVRFYPSAAACESAGYRPCRRCRPETAPGTPAWAGPQATVARALRLIHEGALDRGSVEALARRLGVGGRHLRRLFVAHLGASPAAVARTRRAHFARRLLDETDLPMAEVAAASGFGSLRQFNDTIRSTFHTTPSELRGAPPALARGETHLRLPYREPFDWQAMLDFLTPRVLPGVEQVAEGGYRRVVGEGWIEVSKLPDHHALCLRTVGIPPTGLALVAERVRILFDLGADPAQVAADLRRDPFLAERIAARPGLRVTGAFDPFETAVRIVLGQQVSVKGATTLAARLIESAGAPAEGAPPGLSHHFPSPEAVLEADVAALAMPRRRADAVKALARAVAEDELRLGAEADPEELRDALVAVPGIGPWTAEVIALRALGDPDAFPAGDLGLRKALGNGALASEGQVAERARSWRPWRGYAAHWLWAG